MQPSITSFLLTGIRFYRIAGKLLGITSPCRFYPTCSVYAQRAIELHGLFSGIKMTATRLLRCHPLNAGGVDLPEQGNL